MNGMVDRHGNLRPYSGAVSFYGKARVVSGDGDILILISYSTPVAVWKDGKMHRTWAGYSATTARHIKSFCAWMKWPSVFSKKEWESLPCEDYYTLVV